MDNKVPTRAKKVAAIKKKVAQFSNGAKADQKINAIANARLGTPSAMAATDKALGNKPYNIYDRDVS